MGKASSFHRFIASLHRSMYLIHTTSPSASLIIGKIRDPNQSFKVIECRNLLGSIPRRSSPVLHVDMLIIYQNIASNLDLKRDAARKVRSCTVSARQVQKGRVIHLRTHYSPAPLMSRPRGSLSKPKLVRPKPSRCGSRGPPLTVVTATMR